MDGKALRINFTYFDKKIWKPQYTFLFMRRRKCIHLMIMYYHRKIPESCDHFPDPKNLVEKCVSVVYIAEPVGIKTTALCSLCLPVGADDQKCCHNGRLLDMWPS